MRFFLSYASDSDKKAAEEVKDELEKLVPAHPHQVFVDYESLRKSQDTDLMINSLLEDVDAVLYLVTVSSIRSFWCGKEIGYAQCLGKPIVPIAGPGITAEYIKSQSVPWIAGLKWVNWWEKDRARKIVEGVAHERGILKILSASELEQWTGAPISNGDYLLFGLRNNRAFPLSDLTIVSEIAVGRGKGTLMFRQASEKGCLRMRGSSQAAMVMPLNDYKHPGVDLTSTWLVERQRAQQIQLKKCTASFLVRYCIGGQHYVSSLFDLPLMEVCAGGLRDALQQTVS